MGIDIHGWIEVQDDLDDSWFGVVKLTPRLMRHDRNKAMMGFLFSPYTNYQDAIAANRGLPLNASEEVIVEKEGFQHSWIFWSELQQIEWQERENNVGQVEFLEKYKTIDENTEVVLTGGWKLIFELMETLAKYHGIDKIRLVVWFS